MGATEFSDGVVGQLLHPALQPIRAGDLIALVVVELAGDLTRCGPWPDARTHLLELRFQR